MYAMSRPVLSGAFVAALAVVGVPAGAVGAASAGESGGFETVERSPGYFYGDFVDYVATAGGTLEEFCTDQGTPVESRVYERSDGTTSIKTNAQSVPLYLYASDADVPTLLEETCPLLFDGDPTTNMIQPIATGTGTLKERIDGLRGDGPAGFYRNSVNGTVTGEDGATYKMRAWADLELDDNAFPVSGDPTTFQSLKVVKHP